LLFGALAGLVGAVFGAFVWMEMAIRTDTLIGYVALMSAGIAGVTFGYSTRGVKHAARGYMGAGLGLIAIVLGYYFIYMAPISYEGMTFVAARYQSFGEFWSTFTGPVDYLFLSIGAYMGYKLGTVE